MDPGFDAHLRADDVTFTADDAALLRAVDEHGSLNRAADALGRSYSRAHQRLTALEEAFGSLVARRRGGSDGGGSDLTEDARSVLARFERLRTGFRGTTETEGTVLSGTVDARQGELAAVATDAGSVRALVPEGASDVQVSVPADAVTLHAPDDAPPAGSTSARNRFRGTVVDVDRGEAVARVVVDVGADGPLLALVTLTSVKTLRLEPGSDVVASFKATATRGTPD